jgi:tRNA(adenine34) deaminase
MKKKDEKDYTFMRMALAQARRAYARDEVPIGAIVIGPDEVVLGRGYNRVEKRHQQNAHAEMIAIAKASKKLGDWRLDGCTIYVTLEPCMMCMGFIRLSRIERIVFGAHSKLFGYQLDKRGQGPLYSKDIEVQDGVMAKQAADMLKEFFKQKRKSRD